MTTTEAAVRMDVGVRGEAVPIAARTTTPVQLWALWGGLCLAFILFVWGKWITGPYFEAVPSGPSETPTWMHTVHLVWQVASVFAVAGFFYWFLIRPWIRERRIATDGLLCVAIAFLFFQDPLGSFTGHWFAYNTELWQMGSWVNEIPGWLAFGQPGAQLTEPIVFTGAVYVWAFFGMTLLGSLVMRKAKERWPRMSKLELIGVCFVALALADVVLEGLIWMPLGFYHYGGGHFSLFAGTYHQYPLHEAVTAGALFTGLASMRYFRNDRGETISERGIEKLRVGTGRKTALRFLAMVGVSQAIMLATYNIPVTLFIAPHSGEWPASIQERSYFTSRLCGEGTDRLCPRPGLPNDRGSDNVHLGPDGRLLVPPSVELPAAAVPFDRGKPGGSE